jgi:uncharacterized DUF497 family protein
MTFDWDDANRQHIAEHDVTTDEAEEFIANDPLDLDKQDDEGEERYLQVGETRKGRILLVVSTWRGQRIRIVTAFDAPRRWRRYYLERKVDLYGGEAGDPEV